MPLTGRRDQKFSIAVGVNRKSMDGTFLYFVSLRKNALQKLFTYWNMARIFCGNCGLPALPSIVSLSPHDTTQLVICQTQPPSPGKGWTSSAPWELQLTKGSSKIPTEHCSSISNYPWVLDSTLPLEKLCLPWAKGPVFPTPVWMSPVLYLRLRQRLSFVRVWQESHFPQLVHSFHWGTESRKQNYL